MKKRKEVFMPEQPKVAEEMKKIEYEPLLPIEKKLIGWSIGIGIVLLGILIFHKLYIFPGTVKRFSNFNYEGPGQISSRAFIFFRF